MASDSDEVNCGSSDGDITADAPTSSKPGYVLTSRSFPSLIRSVTDSFTDYKRFLVEEMEWGGMLQVPAIKKLDLKSSHWLMGRVNVEERCLVLDEKRTLRMWPADVHKVFGIPHGPRSISGVDGVATESSIKFIQASLGMEETGGHSLTAVQSFLTKDINENSSSLEKDCFKIAAVIFFMGHLLGPSTKHDYAAIDYWGALRSADDISRFNWCEFVLEQLLHACRKVQSGIREGATTFHLHGCHLFLQIFLLDNLDFGVINLKHEHLPRCSLFSPEVLRRMLLFARPASKNVISYAAAPVRRTVCYTRYNYDNPDVRESDPVKGCSSQKPTATATTPRSIELSLSKTHMGLQVGPKEDAKNNPPATSSGQQINMSLVDADNPRKKNGLGSPELSLASYLKKSYPAMVNDPLFIALREHNAHGLQLLTKQRAAHYEQQCRFADKIVSIMSEQCICCSIRGLKPCLLDRRMTSEERRNIGRELMQVANPPNPPNAGTAVPMYPPLDTPSSFVYETPVHAEKRKAPAATPDTPGRGSATNEFPSFDLLTEFIADSSTKNIGAEKVFLAPLAVKKQRCMSPRSSTKGYAETIGGLLLLQYEDTFLAGEDEVLYGDTLASMLPPGDLNSRGLIDFPINFRNQRQACSPLANEVMKTWFRILSNDDIARSWIVHREPRYIDVRGSTLQMQLIGMEPIDHDTCAILCRRMEQIDCKNGIYCRIILEPDFSSNALADVAVHKLKSIHRQLGVPEGMFHTPSARMFLLPTTLVDGWACYCWDMKDRVIHVLDPCCSEDSRVERVGRHHYVINKLHEALYTCIQSYFKEWHTPSSCWSRNFVAPALDPPISRADSGAAMLYMMNHFDGTSLDICPTKDQVQVHRTQLLMDVLGMEGNQSSPPNSVMKMLEYAGLFQAS